MKLAYPIKQIRKKCMDCCCGQRTEVDECELEKCPLWPYRFGAYPKTLLKKDPKAKVISKHWQL